MDNKPYIMTPELFGGLKHVSGFTNLNGNTYTEHICIIFNEILSEDQKKTIMSMATNKALEYLKTIVDYTMSFSEVY